MDKKPQANQAKGREKGHAKPTALSATAKSEKMAVVASLTGAEKQRLVALEKVIDAKLGDFFEVGSALMEIKSQELFQETHRNFNVYCQERWGFGRSYANKLIGSAERIQLLPEGLPKPSNEFQIRPFLKLEPGEFPKKWQTIVESSGAEKVTARMVEESLKLSKKPRKRRKAGLNKSQEIKELLHSLRLALKSKDLENDSTLISQIHLPLPSPHWDSWSFGCFVASASPELLERLGISTNLVLHAMLCLSERGGDWFAFLLNPPKMLGRIIGEPPLRKERLTRWGRILVDHPHAPANKSIQWWQYPACRLWRTASTPRAHDPKCAHCWSRRVATYGQVFPCGIPSMFVEMFFVSAIFKRIMHKGKSEITVTERPVKPYKKAKVK